MKKITEPVVSVIYPFDIYHSPYLCKKCGQLLRYSGVHERVYVVSELEHTSILHVNHECVKSKEARRK